VAGGAGRLAANPRRDATEGDAMADEPAIEDYFVEDRTFPPPAGFAADALVTGP